MKQRAMNKLKTLSPIAQNWNRMSDLTNRDEMTEQEASELRYRCTVQNQFSAIGHMPSDYIPTDPKYAYVDVQRQFYEDITEMKDTLRQLMYEASQQTDMLNCHYTREVDPEYEMKKHRLLNLQIKLVERELTQLQRPKQPKAPSERNFEKKVSNL